MRKFWAALVGVALILDMAVTGAAVAQGRTPATVIDSIRFDHLPGGLGDSTDFSYDYDDVDFAARVWESPTADGWRVDLDIDVMRGARLTSAHALHDWFIGYEERDPAPAYRAVRVHGHRGWLSDDQLFWLIRPGLAVSVQLDGSRWRRAEVVRTAASARC